MQHCANRVYKQINGIFVIRNNKQILPDIVTSKKITLKNFEFFMMPTMQNADFSSVNFVLIIRKQKLATVPPPFPGLGLIQHQCAMAD